MSETQRQELRKGLKRLLQERKPLLNEAIAAFVQLREAETAEDLVAADTKYRLAQEALEAQNVKIGKVQALIDRVTPDHMLYLWRIVADADDTGVNRPYDFTWDGRRMYPASGGRELTGEQSVREFWDNVASKWPSARLLRRHVTADPNVWLDA